MEVVPLLLLAVAFVGLGSAATVLLTRWIPHPVAQLAAQHGRFVGLGEQRGAAWPAPYRVHVQQEAMNVVRTSN
ncbi:hypothetical protein [Paraburkholderia aromaticivorans]|uniref:Oxalate:formate antiporter n=1 Tax=Paraburkholderia aromaticivorans TaxID=2026199 RepID=A0A248VUL9_9BURK|nr:hypothetical protein [Paraburkholderia aromaticivorans]ASW02718.1 hypothetical protein CJU94_32255 [Paraburkholderia aromaticivorans]